jgi:F5/8 type C domain
MGRGSRLTLALMLALGTSAIVPSGAAALDPVLSNSEKQDALIDMLEDFVPRAEEFWCAKSDPTPDPECTAAEYGQVAEADGFFAGIGDGVGQSRGTANITYVYATLLRARPSQATFGGVARTTMLDHLEQSMLHSAHTNVLNMPSGGWGGGADETWQTANYTYPFGWAAQLMWDELDEDTQDAVEAVVTAEADTFLGRPPDDMHTVNENTAAEDNAWNAAFLALAAAIFPANGNSDEWHELAKEYAINASSRAGDASSPEVVDGVPLPSWISTANLNDDFTLVNHGFFHPVYTQGVFANLAEAAVFYEEVGKTVPQAFSFRLPEVWDDVVAPLMADDGDIVAPASTDWTRHDYQHIPYLAYVATKLQRNDASVLESRAIELLARRQAANGNGSLYGQSQIGYEADVARLLAAAWWIHEHIGVSPEPTPAQYETARATSGGLHQYPFEEFIVARQQRALVTMSWDDDLTDAEPMGLIVPHATGHDDDPVVASYEPNSSLGFLTGNVAVSAWSCDCRPDGFFSTAGTFTTPSGRKFSMTSFSDGTTMLLDRGTVNTFYFDFENVAGLTGPRPVYSEMGEGDGALAGPWVNVADRFGMVVRGGAGITAQHITGANSRIEISGSAGAGSGNRGAVVFPNATAQQTALAVPDVAQPTVSDSSWSALIARGPDGTARLAVARWGGGASATISNLTSPLGSPIPDRPNDVTVGPTGGSTSVALGSPASTGWKGYFWVSATSTVTARPISETRMRLTNGASGSTVTVRYVDGAGVIHTAQQTLPANAVAIAHAIDNGVVLAVPSPAGAASHGPDQAYDGTTSAGNYWQASSTTLPVDLKIDFGKLVDLRGLTMTPVSGNGPRNYDVQLSSASNCGSVTTGFSTPAGGSVVDASSSSATTTTFAANQRARCAQLHITSKWGSGAVRVSELAHVPPTLDIDLVDPLADASSTATLRLARGGYAEARVRVRNTTGTATSFTLTNGTLPTGVGVTYLPAGAQTVPANGSIDVTARLTGATTLPTTGSATLDFTGTGVASETLTIQRTDNLALNEFGTAFPKALASSEDGSYVYPARLAQDGLTSGSSNFWVSAPSQLGASTPECLVIDLGAAVNVGRAVMTPRTNYGPRDYKVQTSNANTSCASESGWTTRDTVTNATNGSARTSTWTPAAARYVRIRITATHGSGPPYWTQVRELAVYTS